MAWKGWHLPAGQLGTRINDCVVALTDNTEDEPQTVWASSHKLQVVPYFWNPNSLAYEVSTGGSTPGANVKVTNFPTGFDCNNLPLHTAEGGTYVKAIDIAHSTIHDGIVFSQGHYVAALAANGTLDILIQVGANAIHITPRATSGGDCTYQIFEGTTFSAAGTSLTPANHDRRSAKTSTATISHTPTVTTTGTQFNSTSYIPGGSGGLTSGASEEGFHSEIILKTSTNYLLRLTNTAANANPAHNHFQYIELGL